MRVPKEKDTCEKMRIHEPKGFRQVQDHQHHSNRETDNKLFMSLHSIGISIKKKTGENILEVVIHCVYN